MYTAGSTVPNPQRGCGKLKAGGMYLTAAMGEGGTLPRWVNLFFSGVTDPRHQEPDKHLNAFVEVSPRVPVVADFRCLLLNGTIVDPDPTTYEQLFKVRFPGLDVPPVCLVDHVGASFYKTPRDFAIEVQRLGPNRRVPPSVIQQIAPHLPCPVVFTHSKMPYIERWEEYCGLLSDAWQVRMDETEPPKPNHSLVPIYTPLWFHPTWSLFEPELVDLDGPYECWQALRDLLDIEDGPFQEQPFGVSWFTQAIYVQSGDENPDQLSELVEQGIIPVFAGESGNDG